MSNIIAVAAGHEITEEEYQNFAQNLCAQQGKPLPQTEEEKENILKQYANYFLFEKLGEERGYDKAEEFQAMLRTVRREILSQYTLTEEVRHEVATSEECQAYYQAHPEMFEKGAEATASHILMAEEDAIMDVLAKIRAGEITFEEAAKEYSTCPSGAQGGSLGTFGRGRMVKEFDQAVFEGPIGEVFGPVQTGFGFHLILTSEMIPASTAPYDEVKDEILKQVTYEKQNQRYNVVRDALIEKYGFYMIDKD